MDSLNQSMQLGGFIHPTWGFGALNGYNSDSTQTLLQTVIAAGSIEPTSG